MMLGSLLNRLVTPFYAAFEQFLCELGCIAELYMAAYNM